MYLLVPFIVQISNKSLGETQSYEDPPFSGPKWPICPIQEFFQKIRSYNFMYLLTPFIAQNFKQKLRTDPKLLAHAIFRPEMANLP